MRSSAETNAKKLDFRPIKQFALERLGRHCVLAEILLQEKDEITHAELLARLPIWLTLVRHIDSKG